MQSIPSRRRSLHLSCLAAVAVIATVSAQAQTTYTWDGGGDPDPDFSNPANWTGVTAPGDGNDVNLIFNGATGSVDPNNDVNNLKLHSLTFSLGAGAFVVEGNEFRVAGGGANPFTNTSGITQTINNDLRLLDTVLVFTTSGSMELGGGYIGKLRHYEVR